MSDAYYRIVLLARHHVIRNTRRANREYWASILAKRPDMPAWLNG